MTILDKKQARNLYNRIAGKYDRLLIGLCLLGINRQRRRLFDRMNIKAGDTVVDLCCGTGENLRYLVDAVGPGGKIIGVDLSPEMLRMARQKAQNAGWKNVELIEADIESWSIPKGIAAVISTFGLEMVPDYDGIVRRAATSLAPDGRLGLLGLKYPEGWPDWLLKIGISMAKPFGVSRDYFDFKPWEAVEQHLPVVDFQQLLFGGAYLCVASKQK